MSKPRQKRTPQEKFKIVMEGLRGDYGETARLTAERRELAPQEAEELTAVSQIFPSG